MRCPFCGFTAESYGNMVRHLRNIHGRLSWCPVCHRPLRSWHGIFKHAYLLGFRDSEHRWLHYALSREKRRGNKPFVMTRLSEDTPVLRLEVWPSDARYYRGGGGGTTYIYRLDAEIHVTVKRDGSATITVTGGYDMAPIAHAVARLAGELVKKGVSVIEIRGYSHAAGDDEGGVQGDRGDQDHRDTGEGP